MRDRRVTVLVEVGLTIALAVALNMVKLWHMPQGGNISLGMLPLFVLAIRRGVGVGIMAGALYGIVDAMIEPFMVHWVQYLLDYPVAFAALGLAGIGARGWRSALSRGSSATAVWTILLPSISLGAALRYSVHVISGYVYFSEYAGEQNALIYSAVYNTYVPIAAGICFAASVVLLPILARVAPEAPELESVTT